jgi:hypothetical protein
MTWPHRAEFRPLDLLRVLVDSQVEFVVIGGFALAPHGYVRATEDLDIVPAPKRESMEKLLRVVEQLEGVPVEMEGGLRPEEMPVPFGLDSLLDGGTWALSTTYGVLHVMQFVKGAEDYDELRASAISVPLEGVGDVWFAGREQLLRMKRDSPRLRDQSDVQELEMRAPRRDD